MKQKAFTPKTMRRADAGVDTVSVNGGTPVSGPVNIVSPMAELVAPNTIRIDNGNSKDITNAPASADINTDLNTAFKVAKIAGSPVTIPAPQAPADLAQAEDRKITFEIQSRGTPTDLVTFTGGAGGYEFANAGGVGPFVADFNSMLAAMPNDSVCKVGFAFSNRRNRWIAVALSGFYP